VIACPNPVIYNFVMGQLSLAVPEVEKVVENNQEEELESLFRVLIHNDDFTPIDFVVLVLLRFFQLNSADAERVTWTAHTSGIALVAILPKKDAEYKVGRAHFAASLEAYPLTFTIEPE
jgi:ATP-dependent Clp protease adaptor protein ClpS